MYGSLLFLGLILGIVFMFATVLIIYYKQISEGYEDRVRFQIMRSIGMSHSEVKSSIRSQILIVFFLPIAFAAVHVAVAFPIIRRLLFILELTQTWLFLVCTIVVFFAFTVLYVVIYSLTARTYYKIVS
ncbi:MAG: FtsX-like permease family protein [Coprococcus sp.]